MARNGSNTSIGHAPAAPDQKSSQAGPEMQGADVLRAWLGLSLASALDAATCGELWQALGTRAVAGWREALASCARDVEQARDAYQVMALPAQLAGHQFEQASQLFTAGMKDLLEAQAAWGEHLRGQAAGAGSASPYRSLASLGNGLPPSAPLAAMTQWQDQWLAMTRGWTDAARAASPARA